MPITLPTSTSRRLSTVRRARSTARRAKRASGTSRFGLTGKAPQKLWFLQWDWLVLGIQVGLAAVGTAVAGLIAHSRLSADAAPPKKAARKAQTRRARADA